jgi:GT2 family glycosyltransferase
VTPTLDIVIVNWNSGDMLSRCLTSVSRLDCVGFQLERVIVVDNASADDSADVDRSLVTDLVRNTDNRGFGRACNQGAALGHADLVLFLNPDVTLEADSLTNPVRRLADDPTLDVVGIELIDDEGNVHRSCCRIPTLGSLLVHSLGIDRIGAFARFGYAMHEWSHEESRFVDHVIGAFYLIRRSTFDALKGFDERFFVYLEDLDLSKRVKDRGGRCLYLADVSAQHVGGGTTRPIKAVRLSYSLRSRLQYAAKHHGAIGATLVGIVTLLIEPLIRLAAAIGRLSWAEVKTVVAGYARLYGSLVR